MVVPKRHILFTSGALALLTIVMGYFEPFRLCGDQWRQCMSINYDIDIILLPVIPLFIFSLVTYRMREEVYKAWFKFARVAIPLSMFLILIAPEYSQDRIYPIEKGSIALLCSALFAIVSIALVAWKHLATHPRT